MVEAAAKLARRFFSSLPPEKAAALQQAARPCSFRAGEVICQKGDPGDAFYVIIKGQVRIILPSEGGEEALLAVLEAGDFFGELSLIDGEPRSATIVATEATETLALNREDFRRFLHGSPEIAIDLLEVLSHRLRESNEFIADAAFLDVPGRLAKKLLDLAENYGRPVPHGTAIRLRLTQRDLASMIGATRESVNKHLQFFRAQGMISIDGRSISVRDADKLQRRAH